MNLAGFDLETPQDIAEYGLQPWRAATGEATIKSVAVWSKSSGAVKRAMPSKEWFRKFLVWAAENQITLVTWNGLFDIAWLLAIGLEVEVSAVTWLDAMLMLKRIDGWRSTDLGGKGYGLKAAVADRWPECAGYDLGEDVTKVPTTESEWVRLPDYNALDSEYTCRLAEEYLQQLTAAEIKAVYIEAAGLIPIAKSYINGIPVNCKALAALDKDVAVRRAKALEDFDIDPTVIASPKKLANLLFVDWGLEVIKKTPKGVPATDKETLLKLELAYPDDKRLGKLMALRKVNTQQSKFVDAVYGSMLYHMMPLTRPAPFIAGTYTGRMTYASKQGKGKAECQTGIALHQWERGKAARDILAAPEGFLLAEFDASGQEMRLMADVSQDETMLRIFNDGIDGHALMGASIEGVEWEWVHAEQDNDPRAKSIRNLGKFANLSNQYRIGVATLRVRALTQYGLNLSEYKTKQISDRYKQTYRGVPHYWKTAVREAEQLGYCETMGHRRIALSDLSKYEQQQTAINFKIQGTGGDMKELAIAELVKTEFNEDVIYAWDLHDALFIYIRDNDQAMATAKRIRTRLDNLPYASAWGWNPSVPMLWDAKIGKTWGTLKGVPA